MKTFKSILMFVIFLISLSLHAEIQTSIPLEKESTNYNINTVDTNSIYTRSDTYEFNQVNVSEIAPLIAKTLSEYGTISINETLNMIVINEQESKLKNIMNLCKKLDIDKMDEYKKILTERIPLSFTQPSDLVDYLNSYLSLDGYIQADDNYNVLIVHDHDSRIELIKNEIKKYDLPPKEVKISLEIFELSSDDLADIGLDVDNAIQNINVDLVKFDAKDYDKAKQYRNYDSGSHIEDSYYETSDVQDDFRSNLGLDLRLSDLLRFMQQNENVKTVSSPSVTTINNTTANLAVLGNLSLSIKPLIGNSEFIKLSIDCEISTRTGQHIVNEVYVKNGDPFILGEVSKTRTTKIQKKVPILGSILPFLFSREVESQEQVKVVIFLTPEIVELEEYSKQSGDIKQQLIPKK